MYILFYTFCWIKCSLTILLNICAHAILIDDVPQFSINLSFLQQQIDYRLFLLLTQNSLHCRSKHCCCIVNNVYIDAYTTWEYIFIIKGFYSITCARYFFSLIGMFMIYDIDFSFIYVLLVYDLIAF